MIGLGLILYSMHTVIDPWWSPATRIVGWIGLVAGAVTVVIGVSALILPD